ncbi:MAG TPA: Hsp70 family protein [Pirellulales bacterium]|jgi:molecular chaperone HscC
MTKILGIDLGTTNSLVAHLTDDGPRVIPNALGDALTPSVVGIDPKGDLLVGRSARELQVLYPERCAALFKRLMGSDQRTRLGDREFTPEQLSSLVLRSLKHDAEQFLGEEINSAVITVPAYFNDRQRKATIAAGQMAGFVVDRIVNEPTAAALAYGFHETDSEKLLLIFDLGGGTFDVSIVEIFEGSLEVRASSGESFLGGEDFTRTLVARVLESAGMAFERTEMESPRMVARLLQQCEVAKRKLSAESATSVRLCSRDGDYRDDSPQVPIERTAFEQWTRHLLSRVELPLRRVLGDARLTRHDIQEVILVGGATRMPAVIELVTHLFGKEPRHRLNPDEVVALGAAVQAGLIAHHAGVQDMVVTDVCPFTLGVETSKMFGRDRRTGYFLPIIQRNTTIPVSRVERVYTVSPNQTEIIINVFQGENRRVEGNLPLGQFEVTGLPRSPAGEESVDIRFTYDLNGVLEVEVVVVSTKKKVTHLITKHAHGLSSKEVEAAVRQMQDLKTVAREEAPNRFLLRRAERVFQELSLDARDVLSVLIDGFEGALQLNDREAIERHRQALESFLDQHDTQPDDSSEEDQSDD